MAGHKAGAHTTVPGGMAAGAGALQSHRALVLLAGCSVSVAVKPALSSLAGGGGVLGGQG